jgi:hypothetical protein
MKVDNTKTLIHSPNRLPDTIHHKLLCRDNEAQKMWTERRNLLAHGNVIICKWTTKIAFL